MRERGTRPGVSGGMSCGFRKYRWISFATIPHMFMWPEVSTRFWKSELSR
jgi:hypothetical protein